MTREERIAVPKAETATVWEQARELLLRERIACLTTQMQDLQVQSAKDSENVSRLHSLARGT